MQTMTIEHLAARYGVSVERIRQQYRDNADGLGKMAAKAENTGKKVNGYTAAQLREHEAEFRRIAETGA
jgi:hypothetical protein